MPTMRIIPPFNIFGDGQPSDLARAYLRNEDLTAGKYKDQRMTYSTAYYQWTKLCERADVKCNIHQLRHTTATELVNSGVSAGSASLP